MGEAKRKKLMGQGKTGSKRARMFHLLKLISRYSDREITRFIDRRIGRE
jgi:hypothetical protein